MVVTLSEDDWRLVWAIAGCASGMLLIGKIAFNPKEVLGRGSEGTFVYRFVSQHIAHTLDTSYALHIRGITVRALYKSKTYLLAYLLVERFSVYIFSRTQGSYIEWLCHPVWKK